MSKQILKVRDDANKVEIKPTQYAGDYIEGFSPNSALDDQLFYQLVPSKGKAQTLHGELLRASSKIYNDVFKHGAINIYDLDACPCGKKNCQVFFQCTRDYLEVAGSEEEYYRALPINDNFKYFFDLLEEHLNDEDKILITNAKDALFDLEISPSNTMYFDQLNDKVIHLIQTTHNQNYEGETQY